MITRFLSPAQKILTTAVVSAVAATCLVSVSGSSVSAKKEGPAVAPAHSRTVAMKEWHAKEFVPRASLAHLA